MNESTGILTIYELAEIRLELDQLGLQGWTVASQQTGRWLSLLDPDGAIAATAGPIPASQHAQARISNPEQNITLYADTPTQALLRAAIELTTTNQDEAF